MQLALLKQDDINKLRLDTKLQNIYGTNSQFYQKNKYLKAQPLPQW